MGYLIRTAPECPAGRMWNALVRFAIVAPTERKLAQHNLDYRALMQQSPEASISPAGRNYLSWLNSRRPLQG